MHILALLSCYVTSSYMFSAEFVQFVVPYLLGWHTAANSFKPEDASRSNNANPRSGAELEWNR